VAWGQNNSGQLGDGKSGSEQAYSDVPVAVCVGAPCEKHLGGVTALAAGGEGSSFALGSDGTVMAWGANEFGQLGTGNMTSPTSPVKVPGLTEVTAIAAGSHHSLDLLRSGKVEAAGENAFGQVGNGTKQNSDKPVPVTEVVGAAAIAGGDLHSLAIGSLPATLTNVQPNAAPPVAGAKVTISGTHLAIASEVSFGTIKAQSFTVNSPTSITVVTPAGAAGRSVDVSATTPAGTTSTSPADKFAWRSGSGLAWGANEHGQLGNGGTTGSDLPVPELGGVVAVAGADGGHSLALLPNGAVRAVGINQYGQLGDGTVTGPETCQAEAHSAPCSRTPVNVTGLGEGVKAIAAGALHSLALMKSGAVRAWGINEEGRLGDNRTAVEQRSSDVPVEVCAVGESEITHTCTEHLSKVKAIAGGLNFSLAVLTSGKVVAWGSNESGQLGDGKTKTEQRFSLVPVYVKGLSGETVLGEKEKVTAIATGYTYALALLESGQVVAWGANEYGQLGDGPNTGPEICERNGEKLGCSRTPVKLTEPNEVSAIAAGAQFSLALLKKSGQVMAWGRNDHGQLGDGKTATEQEISEKPVNVVCTVGEKAPCTQGHLSEVIAIAGGGRHSSALLSNGTVRAWGHNNAGQLGDGKSPTEQPTSDVPVEVTGLSEASAIAGGGEFNLALRNGNVLAWGANEYGQLGIGTNTGPEICIPPLPCSTVPVTMNGLTPLALAAGEDHSLALLSEGTVLSWGDNKSSQLGDGKSGSEQEISDVPVFVCKIAEFPCQIEHVLSEVSAVAAGSKFSLALLTNGRVMAWGSNESGQLGDGKTATEQPSSDFAVEVTGLSEKVTAIAAGGAHALAVLNSGKVVAWGSNKSGQLGDSKSPTEQPTSDVPVEVKGLSEAIGVSGGGEFSLALLKSGVAKAWGSNGAGQLGDGKSPSEQPSSDVSVEVQGLSEATSLAAGESFGYALRGDGTVMAWGENKYGQFGNGTMKGSNKPEEGTLSEVSAIAAGYRFSLYQLRNGTVEGSGEDTKGQLGNGTAGEAFPTPVQAKELTEVTDIAGGGYHSLAIGRL
jgi:alpha-tubulin suppressor-like RCC1 family protein